LSSDLSERKQVPDVEPDIITKDSARSVADTVSRFLEHLGPELAANLAGIHALTDALAAPV
jgi:hypothetical protein